MFYMRPRELNLKIINLRITYKFYLKQIRARINKSKNQQNKSQNLNPITTNIHIYIRVYLYTRIHIFNSHFFRASS